MGKNYSYKLKAFYLFIWPTVGYKFDVAAPLLSTEVNAEGEVQCLRMWNSNNQSLNSYQLEFHAINLSNYFKWDFTPRNFNNQSFTSLQI
jgi:hypothetical protein